MSTPEPIDPRELARRVLDRQGLTLAGDDRLSGVDPAAIARKAAEREANPPTTPAELAARVLDLRDGDAR